MEENKEVLHLLKQIEKANRRQTLCCIVLCIFALISALSCIVAFTAVYQILPPILEIVPQISKVLPEITGLITQMQTVLSNLETTTSQLAQLDVSRMVTDVSELVATGQQGLEQTLAKLNSIDFDTLNKAIKDLAAVVEPLAKVSSVFR